MANALFIIKSVAQALLVALGISVVYFIGQIAYYRRMIRKLEQQGHPVVRNHHPIFGNLLAAKEAYDTLPPGAHSSYLLAKITASYPNHGAVYVDTFPITKPMLTITDPTLAQKTVSHPIAGYRKPAVLRDFFLPITGGLSLFDSNGPAWKYLHNMFAPAFSNANLNASVPVMTRAIGVFAERMRDLAGGETGLGQRFALEPLAQDLVIDIIGHVLLNADLDTQRRPHPLAEAMKAQIVHKDKGHRPEYLLAPLNPVLRFTTWKMGRLLDKHIKEQIIARLRVLLEQRHNPTAHDDKPNAGNPSSTAFRSVLDRALEEYLSRPSNASKTTPTIDDPAFMTLLTRNMRMFFFAGYDSTAATISYVIYNVYSRPAALSAMRAEHDAVLGRPSTPSESHSASAAAAIDRDPSLLNSLPYTQACLKESLRLFPPAAAIREGCADLVLVQGDANGRPRHEYPTAGLSVQNNHWAIQRDPRWWGPRADEYLPERWLVEPGHELYPPRAGWRAFEFGPRTCPGQILVTKQVKAVLACLVREFDFVECYGEMDRESEAKGEGVTLDLGGVGGQRAWMVEMASAHPVGGMPLRVKMSGYGRGDEAK